MAKSQFWRMIVSYNVRMTFFNYSCNPYPPEKFPQIFYIKLLSNARPMSCLPNGVFALLLSGSELLCAYTFCAHAMTDTQQK